VLKYFREIKVFGHKYEFDFRDQENLIQGKVSACIKNRFGEYWEGC
jgi:hypothetical protein